MATMKSYTDIEQSKKLAEILPLESADMYWRSLKLNGHISWTSHIKRLEPPLYDFEHYAPCWSLVALLNALPLPDLVQDKADDELFWQCSVYNEDNTLLCETCDNNPIDACYEMILRLHKLNLL